METTQAEALPLEGLMAEPEEKRRPHLTIRPSRGWIGLDLREIWQFRDLLESLALRDLKLRYKQTVLGVLSWVVLVPLMAAGVFSFVFGTVASCPAEKCLTWSSLLPGCSAGVTSPACSRRSARVCWATRT